MRILYITPSDPLEDWHGGAVRSRFMWNALRAEGDIYTTVVGREKEEDPKHRIKYVQTFSGIKSRISVTKLALLSILSVRMDWAFHGRDYILEKLGWAGEAFDKVVVRLPQFMVTNARLLFEVAYWKIAPMYVDIDDLPSEDFKTTKRPYLSPMRGFLCYWANIFWQSFFYRMSRGAWVANCFQRKWVMWFCKCNYLPNVVRIPETFLVEGDKEKVTLLSIGCMKYPPNVQGIEWFLHEIWPSALEKYPCLELIVVGSKMSDELRAHWSKFPRIVVKGYVADLVDEYRRNSAVVVPIRSGGGTCVKLIEALANGKKVFATSFGARGLSEQQMRDAYVSVFDTAAEFCEGIGKFLSLGNDSRDCIFDDARLMISRNYSAEFFNKQVKNLLSGPFLSGDSH